MDRWELWGADGAFVFAISFGNSLWIVEIPLMYLIL
jgi:hypothetical protein